MIDFSTLQGLTIPEGEVIKIEDAAGNVLWELDTGIDGTFAVKKITSNTYANETTYSDEDFILLDIYPKRGGTVNVTYEGLTKTITDDGTSEEPNAQQVFFGTFNGVADEVETPASGIVTITGDWRGAGCGTFKTSKYGSDYSKCITAVGDLSGIEIIPDYAFYQCAEITRVRIPGSVTTIGSYAFGSCTGLTSVTIPGSVTTIGKSAFSGCTGLTSVTIPGSVTTIGNQAFYNCTGLTSVTIPESVTSIGINPWSGCFESNVISVASDNAAYKIDGNCLIEIATNTLIAGYADATIPSYVTTIGSYAFSGCKGLTSVTIPEVVTTIGEFAFSGCTGLTSVTIPGSATTIPTYCFNSCTSLTSVTIPEGVTTIGNQAFYVCTGLTSVTIPASVTAINIGAFHLQSGYTRTVTMLSVTPPTLSAVNAFNVIGTHNFIVPAGSGDTYKAATYWSNYADYITEAA